MQHWKAKHARKLVSGGALRGLRYEELSQEQLAKAAKRYPSDQKLQKYAKVIVASAELDGNEAEPEPCLPIAIRAPAADGSQPPARSALKTLGAWLYMLSLRRALMMTLACISLVFILKPSLATACAQVFVKFVRLVIRRIAGFVVLLLEGLLDELIYQIEFSIRQALPPNLVLQDMAQAPFNFMSHIFSALTGAGFALLTRRMQAGRGVIPAID